MRANSDAWVRAGTGSVDVVRSFVGAISGDQGNGWYLTVGAATRLDQHEQLHVASSQGHYNTNVVPLIARVANSAVTGKGIAVTRLGAIWDLRSQIKWGGLAQGVSARRPRRQQANGNGRHERPRVGHLSN